MNPVLGLLGIAGIWLTMAMMPLSQLLALSTAQATFFRGVSGLVLVGFFSLFISGLITKPDKQTVTISLLFTFTTLCLFQAFQAWGTNFSALFLDLAVLVPLAFVWRRGQNLGRMTGGAIVVAIVGTMLTLRVFQGNQVSLEGLFWSVCALVSNGLFIEKAGAAKQGNWNKAFWISFGLVMAGLPGLFDEFGSGSNLSSGQWVMLCVIFAVSTGVLNFYSAFIAFANLSSVQVGVLVLGVTPSIIIATYFILGKAMGTDQLFGVALTLAAVLVFGNALRPKKE